MLGINSNINSLVAQQNLSGSQSALSQAITRLSSGKRINSAADDAAGLAISTGMQTQINGLNQGVSNANDGVSMIQTASSGLSQITSSLQRIRTLAVQASNGGLTADNRASLQQEVAQQIAEVNRIASQTTYNGKSVLDGSAGNVSFQVGANVGQTINLNLTQGVSSAQMGQGVPANGSTLGTYTGLSLDATSGATWAGAGAATLTSINVLADGNGGFTFTDQNNQVLQSAAVTALFGGAAANTGNAANPTALTLTPAGALAATTVGAAQTADLAAATNTVNTLSGTNSAIVAANFATAAPAPTSANFTTSALGSITGLNLNADGTLNVGTGPAAISSVQIYGDAAGGYIFGINGTDPTVTGNQLSAAAQSSMFNVGAAGANGATLSLNTAAGKTFATAAAFTAPAGTSVTSVTTSINTNNKPTTVANVDVTTTAGASLAMESIDNALKSVNNIQATLGAAQNRFTAIATTQQAQSTDLAQAQSQITDANFAQETANLSKSQVLQQAGISVLAQANSLPQQVLKLLQ